MQRNGSLQDTFTAETHESGDVQFKIVFLSLQNILIIKNYENRHQRIRPLNFNFIYFLKHLLIIKTLYKKNLKLKLEVLFVWDNRLWIWVLRFCLACLYLFRGLYTLFAMNSSNTHVWISNQQARKVCLYGTTRVLTSTIFY